MSMQETDRGETLNFLGEQHGLLCNRVIATADNSIDKYDQL